MLDTKNLTYLTVENSVQDLIHFAKTVNLPFDKRNGSSNAPNAVSGIGCVIKTTWTQY